MFFISRHGKIYYEIEGSGKPLLLIHGTPFSSKVWHTLKHRLSGKFTFYSYDLLGYGRSEKSHIVSLGVQNEILAELLQYWQLDNCDVIAHDFGGATLLRSIVINRCRFNKILLFDIVALSPWGSPFVQHVKHHEKVFAGIPDYIHKAMVQAYIRDALFSAASDEDIEYLVEPWLGEEGKAAFYRQIAQMDETYTDEVSSHYNEIDRPVCVLWGENDGWIPIEKGRELATLLPHSEFHPVADAGHLLQLDQPDILVEHVLKFFS